MAAEPAPGALVVSGRAADQTSPVVRIEVSLDNDDWRQVAPDGGLADERSLAFHVRIPEVAAGEHTVSVRVIDLAGNTATDARHVTLPRSR
jgi:hypothetical protein